MNYNNKRFRVAQNSENGELDDDTVFEYKQEGNILTCTYSGNAIVQGHLIGLVSEQGVIQMSYHQVNHSGELVTGICTSIPEVLSSGKIKLYESWQWTSGDCSSGQSVLEEV